MCGVTFAKLSNPSAEFDVTSYPTLKGNSIFRHQSLFTGVGEYYCLWEISCIKLSRLLQTSPRLRLRLNTRGFMSCSPRKRWNPLTAGVELQVKRASIFHESSFCRLGSVSGVEVQCLIVGALTYNDIKRAFM